MQALPVPWTTHSGPYALAAVETLTSRVVLRPTDIDRSLRFYEQTIRLAIYREWGSGPARGVVFFLGGGPDTRRSRSATQVVDEVVTHCLVWDLRGIQEQTVGSTQGPPMRKFAAGAAMAVLSVSGLESGDSAEEAVGADLRQDLRQGPDRRSHAEHQSDQKRDQEGQRFQGCRLCQLLPAHRRDKPEDGAEVEDRTRPLSPADGESWAGQGPPGPTHQARMLEVHAAKRPANRCAEQRLRGRPNARDQPASRARSVCRLATPPT
jgi:hypothetical protein